MHRHNANSESDTRVKIPNSGEMRRELERGGTVNRDEHCQIAAWIYNGIKLITPKSWNSFVLSRSKFNFCECRKNRVPTFLRQWDGQPRFSSKKRQKFCSSSLLHVSTRDRHPCYRIGTECGRHNGQRRAPEISPPIVDKKTNQMELVYSLFIFY